MAYNVPDVTGYVYKPRSAQANAFVVEATKEGALYLEEIARAKAAGVTDANKIDYAAALLNYDSRPDTENFANRRAREFAVNFTDQDFARVAVSIAGPVQNSTIGTTSVNVGTANLYDPLPAEPFQPSLSNSDASQLTSGVPAPTAPGAPTDLFAVAGSTRATLSWDRPLDNGGSAITSNVITSTPGAITATVAGDVESGAITGLTAGTAYTFTVRAVNAIGTGVASVASNSVTPTV